VCVALSESKRILFWLSWCDGGWVGVGVGFLVCVRLFGMLEVVIGDGVYVDQGIGCELFEHGLVEQLAFGDVFDMSSYVDN